MIKHRFLKEFKDCERPKSEKCLLKELTSPVVFCVDDISIQITQKSGCDENKHCDEFIFCDIENATGIYCIENKMGTRATLSKIRKQLQGGANIIEERLSPSEKFSFMPVLVTPGVRRTWYLKSKKHKNQLQDKVTLRSEERYIRHIKPGGLLPPHSTMPPIDRPAP